MSILEIIVVMCLFFWKFVLINNGVVIFEDFENLLKEFFYVNIKMDLIYGFWVIFV